MKRTNISRELMSIDPESDISGDNNNLSQDSQDVKRKKQKLNNNKDGSLVNRDGLGGAFECRYDYAYPIEIEGKKLWKDNKGKIYKEIRI